MLQHGERVLKNIDRDVAAGEVYVFTEQDYVDERTEETYSEPDAEFNDVLTVEQIQTLHTVNTYLRALLDGKNVADKKLKAVLTEEQYKKYEQSLTNVTEIEEIKYGDGMPHVLSSYITKVKDADFAYSKFEKMSALRRIGKRKYQSASVSKQYNKSENLYEQAVEHLKEIWESSDYADRFEIQNWLDREVDFDAGADSKIDITADTVPRVRGSKSKNALDSGLPKLSKRLKRKECQLNALYKAAYELTYKPEPVVEVEKTTSTGSTKLQEILKNMGIDDEEY